MCYGCWTEMGKPSLVTPKIEAAAALVKELYTMAPVGGNLHVVTDDWNLDDDHLSFCRASVTRAQNGTPDKYDDTWPEQVAVEAKILDAMEPMTEDERGAVLALESGFIDATGAECRA